MTDLDVSDIDDDLFSESTIHDPHSYLRRLREIEPVHWNKLHQVWMVTRYDDVTSLFRQPELCSSEIWDNERPPYPPISEDEKPAHASVRSKIRRRLINTDPPAHRDYRKALQPFFSPTVVERWREMIRTVARDLLDSVSSGREMDVMADFAVPLPVRIISELMEIPPVDRPWVREVAKDLLIGPRIGEHRMSQISSGMDELISYLTPLAEARKSAPGNDLISVVMAGESAGIYDRQWTMQNLVFLVVAGHETTVNLIGNGTLAFMQNPEEWDRLRSDPEAWSERATEECLRYDPPVTSAERLVMEDFELHGKLIRQGDRIRLFISSANRDPERFDNPETFDIQRMPNPHIGFGRGVHTCLGVTIARIEGQEVFAEMARRYERLHLETDPVSYVPAADLRTLNELRVTW